MLHKNTILGKICFYKRQYSFVENNSQSSYEDASVNTIVAFLNYKLNCDQEKYLTKSLNQTQ